MIKSPVMLDMLEIEASLLLFEHVSAEEGFQPAYENMYITRELFESILPKSDDAIDYNNRADLEYYFNDIIFEDSHIDVMHGGDERNHDQNYVFDFVVKANGVDESNVYFELIKE